MKCFTTQLPFFPIVYISLNSKLGSRDSSVGIALGYELDDRRFESWQGLRIFRFIIESRSALGPTHPHIQRLPGTLSLGVKRLGREPDHSPPSTVEVQNVWRSTSTFQCLHIVVII
jgi:hypothetical protein